MLTLGDVASELLILGILILLNGLFAMAEMAVLSSRKARLQHRAENGDSGAEKTLEVLEEPTRFLSSIQVGITLIGIFTGAFGGITLTAFINQCIRLIPGLEPYSTGISLGLVVAGIGYFSLVMGEIVPKRIAITHPETLASRLIFPLQAVGLITRPLIWFLTVSTELVLKLLRIRPDESPGVTEEEIKMMVRQGARAGVIEEMEENLVENAFNLNDLRVSQIMTPRLQLIWLDVQDSPEVNREKITGSGYSRFLVADGDPDQILGLVSVNRLFSRNAGTGSKDLKSCLQEAFFIPEHLLVSDLMVKLKENGQHLAVVVDEYGSVQGLVTLTDIVLTLVGDSATDPETGHPGVVTRADGSWLVDGMLPFHEFSELAELPETDEEWEGFNTVGGFVLNHLGKIPAEGDLFDSAGFRFEVVDMDGRRIDKLLVTRLADPDRD